MSSGGKSQEQAHFVALAALAQREHQAGRLAEAAAAYADILVLRPDLAEAHNNLGIILSQQGRYAQALPHFERTLALRPDYAEVYNNLGSVLLNLGRLDEARVRYEEALARLPNYPQAEYNLGNALWGLGRLDEAAAHYRQALALRADYADAHYNLGNVLLKQENLADAATCFQQTLALRPDYADAHYNLGNIHWKQGQIAAARSQYEQALALNPRFPPTYFNLGNIEWALGQLDEAADRYEQALSLRPDFGDALWGRAACYLAQGDYGRGWPEYEGRQSLRDLNTAGLPRWNGQPLEGRSVLLLPEQGLGDTLLFIRYAGLLKQRGARVILAVPRALQPLLAGQPDIDEICVFGSAAGLPRCDFHLPLLSAPYAFGTDAATIPARVPYLSAPPDLADRWREELAAIGGFKIGIVWQGTREFGFDPWRSIPLSQFAPLAAVPGVQLISLQKGFGAEQVAGAGFPLIDWSDRLDVESGPFLDTAAVIRNLDLVVAPDTAIAHLAGALGARVFLALSLSPDWRWQRAGDDSPWYPTLKLFRQTTLGDWPDVFRRMAEAVTPLASKPA